MKRWLSDYEHRMLLRGSEFCVQNPHESSQPSATQVLGDSTHTFSTHGYCMHVLYLHACKIDINIHGKNIKILVIFSKFYFAVNSDLQKILKTQYKGFLHILEPNPNLQLQYNDKNNQKINTEIILFSVFQYTNLLQISFKNSFNLFLNLYTF